MRFFRIMVNFTTFRTISGTFVSTSGFWIVLLGHIFRPDAADFVVGSISNRLSAILQPYTGQNTAKRSLPGALEAKPEVEIWRRPVFLTQRPRISIWPKVGQSTQLLPVWRRRLFTCVFRITVNFTAFRRISGTFESTSGFWTVLMGYRFKFGALGFLIESISSRLCAIRRQCRRE